MKIYRWKKLKIDVSLLMKWIFIINDAIHQPKDIMKI